jgi:hypothetical protein
MQRHAIPGYLKKYLLIYQAGSQISAITIVVFQMEAIK